MADTVEEPQLHNGTAALADSETEQHRTPELQIEPKLTEEIPEIKTDTKPAEVQSEVSAIDNHSGVLRKLLILIVLKGISDGLDRGRNPNEMDDYVDNLWKEHMRHWDVLEMVKKDIISHFVLRLVYCRSDELKKWFLSMETALFCHRFRIRKFEEQREIVGELGLSLKAVTGAELESLKEKLGLVARSLGQISSQIENIYYNVPFEEVPDLVAGRRVLLQKGYAFVAGSQLVSLAVTQFRSHLWKALNLTNRKWTTMIREREKHRLTLIVEALSTSYLSPDYSQPAPATTLREQWIIYILFSFAYLWISSVEGSFGRDKMMMPMLTMKIILRMLLKMLLNQIVKGNEDQRR